MLATMHAHKLPQKAAPYELPYEPPYEVPYEVPYDPLKHDSSVFVVKTIRPLKLRFSAYFRTSGAKRVPFLGSLVGSRCEWWWERRGKRLC